MILRKPYAILIKHFKLIHAVLAILMGYLLYRTNLITSFISDYIGTTQTVISTETFNSLFGFVFFVVVSFIMIFTIIAITLFIFKKKPIKFYLYNIVTYLYSIVIYVVAFYTIQRLQFGLLDIKTLKLIQDLMTAAMIFQTTALLVVIIRATGFNIKNFNFAEDLEQIKIEEEDNEEFEVDLEIDTDKLKRTFRKRFRYAKYLYVENMLFINVMLAVFIIVTIVFSYFNIDVYSKVYQKNESFKVNQFIIGINDSYVTKYDYKGNVLKEGYQAVVVRINVKRINYLKMALNTGRISLNTNNNLYYHNGDYKDKLSDLGISYSNEFIPSDEFVPYMLVFIVKEHDVKDKMIMRYTDTNNDVVKINIIPNNLNNKKDEKNVNLNEELSFENSVFKDTKLKIENYEINDNFKVDYQYCTDSVCYPSVEYINVSASDNYDKTILKLVGQITYDESLPIIKVNSVYRFLNDYGSIIYQINGENKKISIPLNEIKTRKTHNENTYYIEIPRIVKDANSIKLQFNIRNSVYTYTLK